MMERGIEVVQCFLLKSAQLGTFTCLPLKVFREEMDPNQGTTCLSYLQDCHHTLLPERCSRNDLPSVYAKELTPVLKCSYFLPSLQHCLIMTARHKSLNQSGQRAITVCSLQGGMSATQSDPKPALHHDQPFTQGKAAPGCGLRRKLRRYKRTVAGVAGSSSSTAAAVQHATGAAAHATESNDAAGESSSGAQDTNPKYASLHRSLSVHPSTALHRALYL